MYKQAREQSLKDSLCRQGTATITPQGHHLPLILWQLPLVPTYCTTKLPDSHSAGVLINFTVYGLQIWFTEVTLHFGFLCTFLWRAGIFLAYSLISTIVDILLLLLNIKKLDSQFSESTPTWPWCSCIEYNQILSGLYIHEHLIPPPLCCSWLCQFLLCC